MNQDAVSSTSAFDQACSNSALTVAASERFP
jgi:hypothetical protein